jgi:hypothetical protein
VLRVRLARPDRAVPELRELPGPALPARLGPAEPRVPRALWVQRELPALESPEPPAVKGPLVRELARPERQARLALVEPAQQVRPEPA